MDQLRDATAGHEPPADASEDDERAKARKAQEVVARTSMDMRQVCLCVSACNFDPLMECAPRDGQDQAADLTVCWAC
jgi:hypothetical protein